MTWNVAAFGLAVSSDLPIIGAVEGAGIKERPRVEIVRDRDAIQPATGTGEQVTILERRYGDGSLGMRVSIDQGGSYRIDAPGHGTFAIAADGSAISCGDLADPLWRWHRPLCAQALPLAATLQGFELFHASAVVLHGRAVAFVASSGTGKTSLATRLVTRGAPLVTDDVLSLEYRGASVDAHPGARMANIPAEQLAGLSPPELARIGPAIGRSDKVHVEVANMPDGPVPLGAIFFLERSERIERVAFAPSDPPDPRSLLAATFMSHISTPARLSNQLDICAEVAAHVPSFRLLAPAALSPSELAVALERELAQLLK